MEFSNIRHIFFDLDHTLWDFDKNSGLAFESIFKKNKISVELEDFLVVYSPINENYWKLYRENKVTQSELRHGRLKETFEALKLAVTDLQIEQLSFDYIDHLPQHNHLLEGTKELLEYLKPLYKMHIITNGFKEVQFRKLEKSGILSYFETITTSEDAGVKKPHQDIFKKALKEASANADESLMIGDNLEADVIGALEAGMKAIIFNYYGFQIESKYHQVKKIRELAQFL